MDEIEEVLLQEINSASRLNFSGRDLNRADLSGANLNRADLSRANLTRAILSQTSLRGANLEKATLYGTNLRGADLREAILRDANLKDAVLQGVDLSGANLHKADLSGVNFHGVNLQGADLSKAILRNAVLDEHTLKDKSLHRTNFNKADLRNTNLRGTLLRGTDLSQAQLQGADLSGADLSWANLSGADLSNANISGCKIYGVSAWDVRLDGTIQLGLMITEDDKPLITVDNLEVAQFINLLLKNQKIREVINAITSKVVLILGRFTKERKPVLDALRDELRTTYNYSPVVFDFGPSAKRDLTETITLLANLSRFVIADLTDAQSIAQELQAIVPDHPSVPIQPILHRGAREYPLFEHYKEYPWVLPIYYYQDIPDLIASIKEHIITPVEQKEYEREKTKELEEEIKQLKEKVRELEQGEIRDE
jgi:uncharacterized protein YjbI with pentapeptide repeats